MFGKKKQEGEAAPKEKVEKLPKPKEITGLVAKCLTEQKKIEADIVPVFKMVIRKSEKGKKAFACWIYDDSEAQGMKVQVKDCTTLDEHPDLILYQGWYDEETKKVELEEKRRPNYTVPLFTQDEIQQKIEALNEPGKIVFFYQARGPAFGGPLGRGVAIVELNPTKGKKYIISTADVIGMEPVANRQKLFSSDKPKEVAKWIKESHHKRMY